MATTRAASSSSRPIIFLNIFFSESIVQTNVCCVPNYRIVQTQISVGAHKAAHVKPLWWEKCNSHRYIFGSLTELMWDLFSRQIFRYTWMLEASGHIKSFCVFRFCGFRHVGKNICNCLVKLKLENFLQKVNFLWPHL